MPTGLTKCNSLSSKVCLYKCPGCQGVKASCLTLFFFFFQQNGMLHPKAVLLPKVARLSKWDNSMSQHFEGLSRWWGGNISLHCPWNALWRVINHWLRFRRAAVQLHKWTSLDTNQTASQAFSIPFCICDLCTCISGQQLHQICKAWERFTTLKRLSGFCNKSALNCLTAPV